MSILRLFTIYTEVFGWKIIPILPKSKSPFLKNWNGEYNKWKIRRYLEKRPTCNIGLLLGDILDIEADSDKANSLLNSLLGNHYHPMYKSEKSVHHLFVSPFPHLTRLVIHGIEFRGKKHQSLLPPSINANGIQYQWLTKPTGLLQKPPQSIIEFYQGNKQSQKKCSPSCTKCGKKINIDKKRYELELKAFRMMSEKWQCHTCRNLDIRDLCRQIKKAG